MWLQTYQDLKIVAKQSVPAPTGFKGWLVNHLQLKISASKATSWLVSEISLTGCCTKNLPFIIMTAADWFVWNMSACL